MVEKFFSYRCDACKNELRLAEGEPAPDGWAGFSWGAGSRWDLCPTCAEATMLYMMGIKEKGKQEDTPIEVLDLSVRSYNALKRADIHTVERLEELSAEKTWKIRNLGKKSVFEILNKLEEYRGAEDGQAKDGIPRSDRSAGSHAGKRLVGDRPQV